MNHKYPQWNGSIQIAGRKHAATRQLLKFVVTYGIFFAGVFLLARSVTV